jgi:WD40 repeat protein
VYKKIKEISGHSGAIYTSCFDGNFIYTGSADHFVTRWKVDEAIQDKFAIKMDQSVYSIEFIDEKIIVVGLSNGSVYLFDLQLNKEVKNFTQHIKAVFSISYNKNKSQFYIGDADGNLSIWNSKTFELLIYLPLDCGKIRNIHVSENGDLFVASCQDGTTRIFETLGFNEIITLNTHVGGATVSHFHPLNPSLLLTGGKDAHLNIWNWQTSELIKSIPAHNYVLYDICFIENNTKFITASRDKSIKIWKTESLEVIQRLDQKSGGHKHSVNNITKITENSFASVGDDKKVIIWEKSME